MTFSSLRNIGLSLVSCVVLIGMVACSSPYLSGKPELVNYTITYNLNGGVNASSNPATYNADALPLTLSAATRTGFSFGGWYSDSGLATAYPTIAAGAAANVTVYAKWTALTSYSITYNLDSGTNAVANPATYTSAVLPLTLASPTRTGYTFGGWYSNSGLTTSYSAIPAGTTGTVVVYAKWTAVVGGNTITYVLNGGTNAAGNPATYTSGVLPLVLLAPTRTGFAFGGWYSDSSLFSPYAFIPSGSTGAKTVNAKWTAQSATNFAMGAWVTTSGTEAGYDLPGYYAVDGSSSTRWSSQVINPTITPAWIALDLGSSRSFSRVTIYWEAGAAGTFSLQESSDGSSWVTRANLSGASNGGTTTYTASSFNTRYFRVYAPNGTLGTAGISIYELTLGN